MDDQIVTVATTRARLEAAVRDIGHDQGCRCEGCAVVRGFLEDAQRALESKAWNGADDAD